jgi:hypothetical protein
MFFEVTLMQLLHIVMNIVILEHLVTQTVTYCHGIWFRRESKRNAPHSYTLTSNILQLKLLLLIRHIITYLAVMSELQVLRITLIMSELECTVGNTFQSSDTPTEVYTAVLQT